jgi:anti-sigma factor RsiW
MKQALGHLSDDVLIRFLDEEMPAGETNLVETHLTVCEECKIRYREFGAISVRLEGLVSSVPVTACEEERDALARQMLLRKKAQEVNRSRVYSQVGISKYRWSLPVAAGALAAGLAFAVAFLPHTHQRSADASPAVADMGRPQTFQVSGETFVALPYSNAELPMSAPHIVEMQVPVSSLTEAGLVFEPVSLEQMNPDRAVLADVLFGVDGEPLGVHVIGED